MEPEQMADTPTEAGESASPAESDELNAKTTIQSQQSQLTLPAQSTQPFPSMPTDASQSGHPNTTQAANIRASSTENVTAVQNNQTPRLAIQRLQLDNFKSYGGIVEVGPFHKSFSSIVGPNGSGKSNVIDAMLFIFGRRAKQLRHSKLSELLHHSSTYPNVTSATVTVFFHDIVDTGDGDDDYQVVPGSQFSVARRALKNNTSKYFLDDREVKMAEVVTLLKSKGVDLDNNRFLILQGEVEQIAMMKPKAVNAHEDGLLEYLEDIIGSNRHIEKIDASSAQVETLNEERGHKLNRVKAAERERDALESAKEEAVDFIDKERELLTKKIKLSKSKRHEKSVSLQKRSEEQKVAEANIEEFSTSVKEKENALVQLEKTFNETQSHSQIAAKTMNDAKDKYTAFERKDIKLREDLKALKSKEKKLGKSRENELKRAEESLARAKQCIEEKDEAEKHVAEVEVALQKAQENFDKIRDKVKKKTAPIRDSVEAKQRELMPYSEAVNGCTRELQVAEAELKLLVEKLEAPLRILTESEEYLKKMKEDLARVGEHHDRLTADLVEGKRLDTERRRSIQEKQDLVRQLSTTTSELRRKVEDAQTAREFSSTRSRLHNAVLEAGRKHRLRGIVGRLGDLATVDSKYSTAVSAAAGANLDCIVVQTAEDAQAAIQFLRKENLGRATFIILEKVEYLHQASQRFSHSDRRADGSRLFDFLQISDPRNCTALYYALRDTLVADTLEEARRMAFKPTRLNRVVTLVGELIESSGAMTGGGRGPSRYRLGSGRSNDGELDPAAFRDLCDRLQGTKDQMAKEVSFLRELEKNQEQDNARLEDLETGVRRSSLEVNSLKERIAYMKGTTLPQLQIQAQQSKSNSKTPEAQKCEEVKDAVKRHENSLKKAKAECEGIESEISALQEKIVAVGGKKFEDAKRSLEECRSRLGDLHSTMSKAASRASAAEGASNKARESASSAAVEIEKIKVEITQAREQSEVMLDEAEKVLEKFKEAEEIHNGWVQKVKTAQADHATVKQELKTLRREEISLVETANGVRQIVRQLQAEVQSLQGKEKTMETRLGKLSLMSVDMSEEGLDENEEEASSPQSAGSEERGVGDGEREMEDLEGCELSSQERKHLAAEIGVLESKLADSSPNLSAISEYKTKDVEYRSQVQELDSLTSTRDAARRECDSLRKTRLDEFMAGFSIITLKLKELYQMITLGGDAELELVDSLDPFADGIMFSVRPPKKSWKNISNLSGGEKTLSSLALVFALHYFKPTPLYFLDEIDAALDYKNVSIVANYVKERTKNAQFIIISLRNNMFELADRLVGIYKTHNTTKSVTIDPGAFVIPTVQPQADQVQAV